ncbi:MAG: toprim domain-containing protein, partial [Nitrosomonas sp.]|nr:toprim domain-containing protein [Nitrosomonas sp.]
VAGSQKEGHFHVVNGNSDGLAALTALNNAKTIIIAEGYSTADTVSQAMNCPVAVAFDSGNLIPVAQQLHDKYPNKSIVIAGDDDQHLVVLNGRNTGREKSASGATSQWCCRVRFLRSMNRHRRNSVILTIWPIKVHWACKLSSGRWVLQSRKPFNKPRFKNTNHNYNTPRSKASLKPK